MKVLLAGGGTAGHINPALAIAGYIKEKEPDTEFLFIGNRDGMEQRLVSPEVRDLQHVAGGAIRVEKLRQPLRLGNPFR